MALPSAFRPWADHECEQIFPIQLFIWKEYMMETSNLKLQVYQILKSRIMDGVYPLGEKLNIDAICKELSVSNSPVREALTLLVTDRLVVMLPNTGAHVVSLESNDYLDLTNAANIVLMGAYEFCLRTGRKAQLLSQLEEQFVIFKRCVRKGVEKQRIRAILMLDRSFVSATGNRQCTDNFDQDLNLLFLAHFYNHRNRSVDWQYNIRRSRDLIDAVKVDQRDLVWNILCERTHIHLP